MTKKKVTLESLSDKMDRKFDHLDKKIESSIEKLAIMTQNGFREITDVMATKDDIKQLVDRIDVIEYKIVGGHERRIDRLEDRVQVLETKRK